MRVFAARTSNFLKLNLNVEYLPLIPKPNNFKSFREFSQSTAIPKKQLRVCDYGYENYMEVEKKTCKVLKFHNLILSEPSQLLPISRLESSTFVLKFPHVFEIFEHPIEQECRALATKLPRTVTHLRKLLMMSNKGRLRLKHMRIPFAACGLSNDLHSVVLGYP
ncbi:Protein ROOT PRIMORDIUM DEFECTIVE 1 [Glycine soja]